MGGILLGTRTGPVTRIEDYELIPIEYKRGPSYLFSEEDHQAFDLTFQQLNSDTAELQPIGYFRSHTRDGQGLGEEDLSLIWRYLPEPETVALIIRPFGTKPSIAGFYFKENGTFQDGPPLLEFPFRRKDLAPDDASPSQGADDQPQRRVRGMSPRDHGRSDGPRRAEPPRIEAPPIEVAEPLQFERPGPSIPERPSFHPPERRTPHRSTFTNLDLGDRHTTVDVDTEEVERTRKKRKRSIWMPLSSIFLLLGLVLGFQAALTIHPQGSGGVDPYILYLAITPSGNDLQIKWDKQAPAVKTAQRGLLTIDDGTFTKQIDLDSSQLQNGGIVVYHRLSNSVRFRLQLFVRDRVSVTETAQWQQ